MTNEILDIVYVKATSHAQLIKNISSNNKVILYLFDNFNVAQSFAIFKNNQKNNFIILPDNFLLKFIKLSFILILLKIQKKKIIFFHECCNLKFDFLVNILNCKGYYCPFDLNYNKTMTKIDNFLKLKKISLLKKIYYIFLSTINSKNINYYYREKINGIGIYTISSNYPNNIKVLDYKKFLSDNSKKIIKKKIIFIFHNPISSMHYKEFRKQFDVDFEQLIKFLEKNEIEVHLKDHPNELRRLNVKNNKLINLDSGLPCEFLEDEYLLAIGFVSNPLFNYYINRSVSLIDIYWNYLENIHKDIYNTHLNNWSIQFNYKVYRPKNIKELIEHIKKKLSYL